MAGTRKMDRPRQIAVAYRAVAKVNHYLIGIVGPDISWDELCTAKQHLIAWQNKALSYTDSYKVLDRAIDLIEADIAAMERGQSPFPHRSSHTPAVPLSAPDSDRDTSGDTTATPTSPIAVSDRYAVTAKPVAKPPRCTDVGAWMDEYVCGGNTYNQHPGVRHYCHLEQGHGGRHVCACGAIFGKKE